MRQDPLACKRQLAYIPDNPDLYEYMTGTQYLHFIADIFQIDDVTRRERIQLYAQQFDLTKDLTQAIAYSHGMKQKLAIVAAWLHAPQLIVMGEPFVGLDPKAAHTLKEMMRAHCRAGGAIFFSTHVLEVAEKLCDKVAVIADGKLICSGNYGAGQGRRKPGGGVFGAGGGTMLKTLLKKQITEIFRGYFFNPKTGKRRSGGATAAMLCYFGFLMIAVLGGMFALLSYVLCAPLHAAGLGWMYFAMMGLLASFFRRIWQRV